MKFQFRERVTIPRGFYRGYTGVVIQWLGGPDRKYVVNVCGKEARDVSPCTVNEEDMESDKTT